MTRFPNALMLTAALCVLSAPLTHAAQRQRRAERPDSESSPPARTAVPRGEAAQPAPDRGEAARPAPDSGRGASSAGRERGVDNAGRSRIPARFDEGRAERTPEARARAPRPSPPPPDTSNVSNSQPVNTDQAGQADDSARGSAVVPRWPTGRPTQIIRTDTAESADDGQRHAVPRGSRPRGDNPATGTAVPRSPDVSRGSGDGRGGTGIYGPRGRTYNNYHYYYYPRRWYPYGYGAFGLGYFYYDPYTWYGYDPYSYGGGYPYYGGGYGGYPYGGYGNSRRYEFGELRLQVEPRHAEVYVDGYFAGHVDDFDGIFQSLTLEDGGHKIEIVAPGFETLEVDIRILPGRKVTYRGALKPRP